MRLPKVTQFHFSLYRGDHLVQSSVHTEWDEVVELVRVSKKKLVDAGFEVKETRTDSVYFMDQLSKGYPVRMSRLYGGKYAIEVEAIYR